MRGPIKGGEKGGYIKWERSRAEGRKIKKGGRKKRGNSVETDAGKEGRRVTMTWCCEGTKQG